MRPRLDTASIEPAFRRRSGQSARLALRGPVVCGVLALAALSAAGWAACRMPFSQGVVLVAATPAASSAIDVSHRGGVIASVLVTAGQRVAAGDVLATLTAGDVDARVATLKVQLDAAQRRLDQLRHEVQAFNILLEQRLVARSRVSALESQVAALEAETGDFLARIAQAEQELAHVEIRAPVAGTVHALHGLEAGRTIAPGETLAQIAPHQDRIVLEARLLAEHLRIAAPGAEVPVWLGAHSWRDARPLRAKLVWVSPEAIAGADGNAPYHTARIELDRPPGPLAQRLAALSGMRIAIVLNDDRRTLIQQLLHPIRLAAGPLSPA